MEELLTRIPFFSNLSNSQLSLRLLFWEVTAACNLRCRHCRRLDEVDKPLPGEMTTEEGKRFLEDVSRIAHPIIVFSGVSLQCVETSLNW